MKNVTMMEGLGGNSSDLHQQKIDKIQGEADAKKALKEHGSLIGRSCIQMPTFPLTWQ